MSSDTPPARRRSRIGLYAPFGLLLLLVIGWSVAWFVIKSRTEAGLDGWIAAEAAGGRRWTCADRGFGGYPFRVEIRCASLALQRPDIRASIGQVLVVSQIYQPRRIIAEAAGPLAVTAGDTRVEAQWKLLQASVLTAERGFERISLAADAPTFRIAASEVGPTDIAARHLEAHLRPDPATASTLDVSLRSDGTTSPLLDQLLGSGRDPADLQLQVNITQAGDLPARPIPAELERWRAAGGKLDATAISLRKGQLRAEGKGALSIDAQHRPEGRLELAAAGVGDLVSRLLAEYGGIRLGGGLVNAVLGGGAPPAGKASAEAPLSPLPPLQLQGGRLTVGPFSLKVRVPPLY